MLKLTTDKHEALRGLSATAELLVNHTSTIISQKNQDGSSHGLCQRQL